MLQRLPQNIANIVAMCFQQRADTQGWMTTQMGIQIACFVGIKQRLSRLTAHPGNNLDTVVAKNYQ